MARTSDLFEAVELWRQADLYWRVVKGERDGCVCEHESEADHETHDIGTPACWRERKTDPDAELCAECQHREGLHAKTTKARRALYSAVKRLRRVASLAQPAQTETPK